MTICEGINCITKSVKVQCVTFQMVFWKKWRPFCSRSPYEIIHTCIQCYQFSFCYIDLNLYVSFSEDSGWETWVHSSMHGLTNFNKRCAMPPKKLLNGCDENCMFVCLPLRQFNFRCQAQPCISRCSFIFLSNSVTLCSHSRIHSYRYCTHCACWWQISNLPQQWPSHQDNLACHY